MDGYQNSASLITQSPPESKHSGPNPTLAGINGTFAIHFSRHRIRPRDFTSRNKEKDTFHKKSHRRTRSQLPNCSVRMWWSESICKTRKFILWRNSNFNWIPGVLPAHRSSILIAVGKCKHGWVFTWKLIYILPSINSATSNPILKQI